MENNIQGQYRQVVNLAPPEDREFPRFDDLAAELRIMIWKAAIPRRFILPRISGSCFSAPMPAIAWVNRESRAVAIEEGGPYATNEYFNKSPRSTWFNPRRDVVLYSGNDTSVVTPHDLLDQQLWDHVTSIVVRHPYDSASPRGQFNRDHLSLALKFAGLQQRDPDCRNIEEILVWLGFGVDQLRDHPTYPVRRRGNAADLFLGMNAVRVVDLSDSKDDKDIDRALGMDPDSEAARVLHDIRRARSMYLVQPGLEPQTTRPDWWEQIVLKSQLHWLRVCFLAESSASQNYVGRDLFQQVDENDKTKVHEMIDISNPWIARMMAAMPKLRPVGVYAENNDSYIKEWIEPPLINRNRFDSNTKQWI